MTLYIDGNTVLLVLIFLGLISLHFRLKTQTTLFAKLAASQMRTTTRLIDVIVEGTAASMKQHTEQMAYEKSKRGEERGEQPAHSS